MSSTPEQPEDSNPYNIDYAREKRLMRTFVILIGTAFFLAVLLLLVALIVDLSVQEEVEPPPDFPLPANATGRDSAFSITPHIVGYSPGVGDLAAATASNTPRRSVG